MCMCEYNNLLVKVCIIYTGPIIIDGFPSDEFYHNIIREYTLSTFSFVVY